MKLTVGALKRLIVESYENLAKRSTTGLAALVVPYYEGDKMVVILEPIVGDQSSYKIVASMQVGQLMKLNATDGSVVQPYAVQTVFGSSPASAVAVFSFALAYFGQLTTSRSISPAAQRFVRSFYEKNKHDQSRIKLIDKEMYMHKAFLQHVFQEFEEPWRYAVYMGDRSTIDVDTMLARGKKIVNISAKRDGVKPSEKRWSIAEKANSAFRNAYSSERSEREIVKNANKLSSDGGEVTGELLNTYLAAEMYTKLGEVILDLKKEQIEGRVKQFFHVWAATLKIVYEDENPLVLKKLRELFPGKLFEGSR